MKYFYFAWILFLDLVLADTIKLDFDPIAN